MNHSFVQELFSKDFGALKCVLFSLLFEVLVYLIDKFVSLPPRELSECVEELAATRKELCSVKSVQQELVRHSKLSRKSIKLEKEIELIKETVAKKLDKWRSNLKKIRMVCFIAFSAIIYQLNSVAYAPAQIFWPFSIFLSGKVVSVSPIVILFVSGLAWQYLFDAFFPVLE